MKTITVYSLKIKIINLQFKIRAIQPSIVFTISLGGKTICEQQVQFKNGLLKQNLSLAAEVTQNEINRFSQVTVIISQKKLLKQDSIGVIKLPFQDFMNSKMKKIGIKSCFDSSAYIQAFLLLIPQRIIQEQPKSNKKQTEKLCKLSQSKKMNSFKKVYFEKDQMSFDEFSLSQSKSKQNKNNQIATQTYDIETLLNLSEVLRQNNQKLKEENSYLKTKTHALQEKIYNLANIIQLGQALKTQIQELENKVMQKQFEVISKDQIITNLKQQKQSLTQQIQQIKQNLGIKQEFKIDTIIGQLGKYADTAKKYKSKISIDESRLAIPKLSIPSGQIQKQNLVRTSRSRKDQLKYLLSCGQSRLSDETFDSLKESIIKKVNS